MLAPSLGLCVSLSESVQDVSSEENGSLSSEGLTLTNLFICSIPACCDILHFTPVHMSRFMGTILNGRSFISNIVRNSRE